MKGLSIIKCIGVFVLLFFSKLLIAQDRPNILWITFEDTSPQFIGCYGNTVAETPVMDKMASEGVRFTNAFSTGTVCSASRSTIITGIPTYKLGTGNHRSNYAIPDFVKGFPKYLKENGYYATNNKKTDYNVENAQEFIKNTWDESSKTAGWWNKKEDRPFFSVFNVEDSHQSRTMSMTYEWYEKNVLAYLPRESNNAQPISNEVYDYKNTNLSTLDPEKSGFIGLHKKHWISEDAFKMPPFYKDSPQMRKQMARVYNSLKLADMKMGRLLQRLKNDGLMENTIVFIFSDHGEGIPRAKTNGIGLGYRIPFMVWFPEKYKHLSPWGTGVVTDELINFEDLAPTMLSLTATKIPDYLKGRPFLGDKRENAPEYKLLSSDRADNGIDLVRTITDGEFIYSRNFLPFFPEVKYLRYVEIGEITQQMHKDYEEGKLDSLQKSLLEPRPTEVLYNLQNDPWETENLIEKEDYSAIAQKMRALLEEKVLANKDILFAPEYELEQISKTGTPYEYRLNDENYPLNEIFEVANLVGKDDTKKELFKSLESSNKFVRYWASIGLYAISNKLSPSELKTIQKNLDDSYAPVRLNLAATLYASNQNKKAEIVLKEFMLDASPSLALSAINYTLYFKNREAFTSTIKKAYEKDNDYKVKAACVDFMDLEGLVSDFKQS
ncbi:sulfatase family protein [Galbibacter mesophilus]|uniref:sulfatase family protein n=1 Tax=Galbibacter mesophilus TaxID=379069 RepID=UPI00191EB685|nr:sulfatase [Galbibacter mesophilus]MCM5664061.1 sulfatase [Galbibacter mesophilus]